jgi:hypothetical protein
MGRCGVFRAHRQYAMSEQSGPPGTEPDGPKQ